MTITSYRLEAYLKSSNATGDTIPIYRHSNEMVRIICHGERSDQAQYSGGNCSFRRRTPCQPNAYENSCRRCRTGDLSIEWFLFEAKEQIPVQAHFFGGCPMRSRFPLSSFLLVLCIAASAPAFCQTNVPSEIKAGVFVYRAIARLDEIVVRRGVSIRFTASMENSSGS
jgi:hypothetical protein